MHLTIVSKLKWCIILITLITVRFYFPDKFQLLKVAITGVQNLLMATNKIGY